MIATTTNHPKTGFWRVFKIVFYVFASLALLAVIFAICVVFLIATPSAVEQFHKAKAKAQAEHSVTNTHGTHAAPFQ